MPIHAALHHVTQYDYDRPVQLGPQVVRLRPAPHCRSRIVSYSLQVTPPHFINWLQDPMGNYQARLVFPQKTSSFKVTVDVVVEMGVYNPFDFFLEKSAEAFPFTYEAGLMHELTPFLTPSPGGAQFKEYLQQVQPLHGAPPVRTIDFLVALNQRLQSDIRYLIRLEPGVQTPDETLSLASGSCRDSAWLLVQLLRHCGLAARFVSGYLVQLTPDVKPLEGPAGTSVDFADLHAWCEVYLPGAGWIGLDPTSGLLAGEGHIPLACTPEPSNAAPIEGLVDEAEVEFQHHMAVTRVLETPRVTRPYTDEQWRAVLALGSHVDHHLREGDVRLTMGGEPTFVAESDRDAPEWNTDALGPTKRGYATDLVQRLRAQYGQGGFLHFGQGKWYPAEQLPRWALGIYWRTDGKPCWHNPDLFADERQSQPYSAADAQRFIEALAQQLNVDQAHILPGYEDTWYYLWRERRLPTNVDPFDARLDDPLERERLRRVFAHGLNQPVGYALPLQPLPEGAASPHETTWRSGPWFLRDERLYLLPGDSPMGYRLPLDSLPWVQEADYPYVVDADPFAPRAELAGNIPAAPETGKASHRPVSGRVVFQQAYETASTKPGAFESAHWITRTALCVEVRTAMYVFMPPMSRLEDYLHLLSAVEKTAQSLGVRIVIEGYPPPRDPRLKVLQVTPDPGVIEVNIHPAHNWDELVAHTEFLYQAAFESGLSAQKFMTDGRHTGTGGGNHMVLGGPTPADSPFLRRPELLASLILYWHNHPSLSYLFSGLFLGPTSQSPRVDEARNDQLYELEIAVREIHRSRERHGADMSPWLVDRTLRNILIDVTGNTHRSEFCIDKLYSPDTATGRLGLLELRAFEMPPHARMSVVQQLLLRALVAKFWEQPYLQRATRWGTQLHDRFMLPHFVWSDFLDVLQDLRQAGFGFDPAWFAPHYEFKFPHAGQIDTMGMSLQVRHALEPWHVMGEEGMVGGTVRYVDSSLERLEVRINGFNAQRYAVTVNSRTLPLQPTGVAGEYVAGVRFRAWAPASALHPTIGVHAPLIIDVVDTWMKRSVGGCQYHVTHPGGRNYTSFPINAYEAESRRLSRFFTLGHTPGPMPDVVSTHEVCASKEFPFTLDLRC